MDDPEPQPRSDGPTLSRRAFVGATAATAVGAGVGLGASTTAAAEEPKYGDWFSNVSNYESTVDRRGEDEVTVEVGAKGNNGSFAFGPAAVWVDPGTTVVWKWVGGSHNVVAEDGSFESELVSETGHTFEHTFEESGVYKYYCSPHEPMGMKGAVAVGDVPTTTAGSGDASSGTAFDYGTWFENVSNFEGTADETGASEVTVTVGAEGNNGSFAFGPAAVHVDTGTTVVWEWNGKGGSHNVVAQDGSFESELVGEEGHTFEHTFEKPGIYRYYCDPHEPMGMKGAVVVGDPSAAGSGGAGGGSDGLLGTGVGVETAMLGGGFLAAFCSPIALVFLTMGEDDDGRRPPGHVPGD